MIIPIRCFTCGEILADKWSPFIVLCNQERNIDEKDNDDFLDVKTINLENSVKKSVEAKVLDKLDLKKMCCRRMMLSNVQLISYIN